MVIVRFLRFPERELVLRRVRELADDIEGLRGFSHRDKLILIALFVIFIGLFCNGRGMSRIGQLGGVVKTIVPSSLAVSYLAAIFRDLFVSA